MPTYANQRATFMPGSLHDDYTPPAAPELVSPLPQRHMPEMSDQISEGIANMDLRDRDSRAPDHSRGGSISGPSPFPRLHNAPPNVPPSDDDFEKTLEHARIPVLTSNNPEMQLSWAQDVLQLVATSTDKDERLQAIQGARPNTPLVEHQLKVDAMNIVTFLADQHHPRAEFMRGMWWEFGRFGLQLDKKEAFRCYSRSADKGYARAEYRIGMLYEASNDPVKALQRYHKGVSQGDSASLYRLGMMTMRGQHGQQQDFVLGVDLIRQSAELADENAPQGAYVYGMLLARQLPQIVVPDGALAYDERAAKTEIEKAAYMRFSKAQLKMGSAYELGALGCEPSAALSLHYYRLAARQGEVEAEMGISKWFLVGYEGLFPKNEEMAYVYAQRAASAGDTNAEFAMGYFHELGIWVPRNIDTAMEWYVKAANNGNTDAQGRIQGIARKQVLSRKDHENVAVTRIRSQYGSKRGHRPARLARKSPNLAPVPDQPSQDPRFSNAAGYIGAVGLPPPRTSSMIPYPIDDGPPSLPPVTDRPATTAPYPADDRSYQSIPPSRPQTTQPPDRPTAMSSFSFTAEPRPESAAPVPKTRQRYPSGPGLATRPAPAADPRGRPGLNMRHVSSPAGIAEQRHEGPPPPMPQLNDQRLDIGFSAPLDDRRTRPQRQNPHIEKPAPQTPPPMTHHPATERPLSGRPTPLQLAAQSTMPNAVSPTPLQNSAARPQTETAPPPKKGPKTFEEMGVPATKQNSECIVM